MKDNIVEAFHKAELDKSNLREHERDLYGESSKKIRHTINNICGLKENLAFLELGAYRGSTTIAANYGNKIISFIVDDFTMDQKETTTYKETSWNNVKLAFEDITSKYPFKKDIVLFSVEATKVPLELITKKISLIHYDLNEHHTSIGTVIKYYLPVLDNFSILMISNWNSQGLRRNFNSFFEANENIKAELIQEKLSTTTGDSDNWYNGFAVFSLTLTNKSEK
jgi:hypothetical protein